MAKWIYSQRCWCVGFVASLVMCLTGCAGKYTGGGSIGSIDGEGKATFGFNAQGDDTDGDELADDFKGQLQYNDHGAGVRFHGEILEVYDLGGSGYMTFLYTPQGVKNGAVGFGDSFIADAGEPGIDGDSIDIFLYDGEFGGYYNYGYIQGGNIQFHPPE